MDFQEHKTNQNNEGVEFMSTATVQKWGNSLAVRIPKEAADRINIDQGTQMELRVMVNENENSIILIPRKKQKKYTLEDLLSKITPENRHGEIDFGIEGNELI